MTCALCSQPINAGDEINHHHSRYRSQGGTETEATHKACHMALHSARGDFKAWGRTGGQISALSKQWAFNLLNVRNDPAHEINRASYLMSYAH